MNLLVFTWFLRSDKGEKTSLQKKLFCQQHISNHSFRFFPFHFIWRTLFLPFLIRSVGVCVCIQSYIFQHTSSIQSLFPILCFSKPKKWTCKVNTKQIRKKPTKNSNTLNPVQYWELTLAWSPRLLMFSWGWWESEKFSLKCQNFSFSDEIF